MGASGLAKAVMVLAVVSLMVYLMADWTGATKNNAWRDFGTAASTSPWDSLPPWPTFNAPVPPSGGSQCGWDLACWANAGSATVQYATSYIATAIIYLGQLLFTLLNGIFLFLAWFFITGATFMGGLLSMATAPLSIFQGSAILVGIAIFLPLWAYIGFSVLNLIRGTNA